MISSKRHFHQASETYWQLFHPVFYLASAVPQALAGEKGASSRLSTLPLKCHSFALHKGDFHDTIALHYGWSPQNLPSNCVCSKSNTIEHALSCPNGAFPTIRHNDIRYLTTELMSEVCQDVSKEPSLHPLSGESLPLRTYNRDDGARLDIKASGFWGGWFQSSFFRCLHI